MVLELRKIAPDLDCSCTVSPIRIFPATIKSRSQYDVTTTGVYSDVHVTLELWPIEENSHFFFQIKHPHACISVLNVVVRWTGSLIYCRPTQSKLEEMI